MANLPDCREETTVVNLAVDLQKRKQADSFHCYRQGLHSKIVWEFGNRCLFLAGEAIAMIRIIVDDELRNKLHNFAQPLELCDETGQLLARLVPQIDATQYEPREPSIGEEELRRRERSNKWYTTAEVLAHLKRLENDSENS